MSYTADVVYALSRNCKCSYFSTPQRTNLVECTSYDVLPFAIMNNLGDVIKFRHRRSRTSTAPGHPVLRGACPSVGNGRSRASCPSRHLHVLLVPSRVCNAALRGACTSVDRQIVPSGRLPLPSLNLMTLPLRGADSIMLWFYPHCVPDGTNILFSESPEAK
jgi:hypothetical protein